MSVDTWDEIRTAYQVARLGTVSGAAEGAGRSPRHRHPPHRRAGKTPWLASCFSAMPAAIPRPRRGRNCSRSRRPPRNSSASWSAASRVMAKRVSGELVITSITGISSLLTPVFAAFQDAHPAVTIRFISDMRVFRLDYGEAHVAIRAGGEPQEPDNVVLPLVRMKMGLYASASYVQRHGRPETVAEFARHRFVGPEVAAARAPFYRWLNDNVPPEAVTYRNSDPTANADAIRGGLGIGFMPSRSGAARQGPGRDHGPAPGMGQPALDRDPCRSAPLAQGAKLPLDPERTRRKLVLRMSPAGRGHLAMLALFGACRRLLFAGRPGRPADLARRPDPRALCHRGRAGRDGGSF